ncbi:MAG TPA: glycoside hydrolase family 11 protein [Terracidiphilus sp.]|nr:glycoside hydrolase family 11 protein [Terracidiphilus sp.]
MAANAQTVYNNGSGTSNGYYYALYTSSGSATLTLGSTAGNYALSWSNAGDVVGGVGWNPGSARIVGYNVGSATGYNVISLYGWTQNPLVEYYVTELGQLYLATATYKGSVSSDGHNYSTYEHQQVNQPSIVGTATFEQYLDQWGGQSIGTNGTITLANHFNHWNSLGMNMGSFAMQYLATESWSGGSGYANATVWTASSSGGGGGGGGGGGTFPTGTHKLINSASGQCADDSGGSTSNGTKVQQYTCYSGANQNWVITSLGNGYYSIGSQNNSSAVWNVTGNGTSAGTAIQLYSYWSGGTNEQFQPVASGSGYELKDHNSGLCVADPGGSGTAGQQLEIEACNGASSVVWKVQ